MIQVGVEQRMAAAALATYTGSPEHKVPHARSDATRCPPDLEAAQENLTTWLRQAIRVGNIGGLMEAGFPRYVWYRDGHRVFEGRLTNQIKGEYKGYPITSDEVPAEFQELG
ncbi:MAG: hypothetical protein ABSC05_21440 [Candidatus Solibacter sp.]